MCIRDRCYASPDLSHDREGVGEVRTADTLRTVDGMMGKKKRYYSYVRKVCVSYDVYRRPNCIPVLGFHPPKVAFLYSGTESKFRIFFSFPSYTGDNGNAIFQSYLSKLFKKETG